MEFSLPVRVRWDIDFGGAVGRVKRIARHIHEIGPLAVELRIDGSGGLAQLPAVFNEIHRGNPRVEVGIRLFPGAADVLRWGYPVRVVWLLSPEGPFSAGLPDGAAAMAFCPDEDSIDSVPGLLEDYEASAVPELHLTNVNAVRSLASRGHVPVPRPEKLRDVAAAVARLGLTLSGKRLVVHDYFLWRLLKERFPAAVGERVEFSGCQAAQALAYVDWEGNVYPCDSLPIRIGNILETPFGDIWGSPVRASLAASIRATPDDCSGCGAWAGCLAGCRGLAYVAAGTLDARDPGCRESKGRPSKP